MGVAVFGAGVLDQNLHGRNPSGLLQCHNVERSCILAARELLIYLCRHDARWTVDLAEVAVKAHFMSALSNDVAPSAANAKIDFAHEPLGCLEPPPSFDKLGCGVRLENQVCRRVELS